MNKPVITTAQCEKYKKFDGALAFMIIAHSLGIVASAYDMFAGYSQNNASVIQIASGYLMLAIDIIPLVAICARRERARIVYVCKVVISIALNLWAAIILGSTDDFITYLTSALVSGVVWSIYLYRSTRVKVYLGLTHLYDVVDSRQVLL